MKLSARGSDELLAWAAPKIACLHGQPFPDNATAMGVESEAGDILGVIAFHSWEPWHGTIEVSAVSIDARWLLARKAIKAMYDYAFLACDCQKIWSRTPRSNERALRLVKALGLTYEAILPRQFGNDDAVISRRFRESYYSPRLTGLDVGNARLADAVPNGDVSPHVASGQVAPNAGSDGGRNLG